MPSDGNRHIGHRDRLRERFISDGLDGFEEHNILELLLFYTIPQKDTNELAHSLLDAFGSLEGVFNASPEALMQVDDVGEHTAYFMSMISEVLKSYIDDRRQNEMITGVENITGFAVRKLSFSPAESLLVFFIDNKCSLLSWHCLQEDIISPGNIDKRAILRMVMGTNTTYVMLARNYIGRRRSKSGRKDHAIAHIVSEALRPTGVKMLDYIIVGGDHSFETLFGNAYMDSLDTAGTAEAGDLK